MLITVGHPQTLSQLSRRYPRIEIVVRHRFLPPKERALCPRDRESPNLRSHLETALSPFVSRHGGVSKRTCSTQYPACLAATSECHYWLFFFGAFIGANAETLDSAPALGTLSSEKMGSSLPLAAG